MFILLFIIIIILFNSDYSVLTQLGYGLAWLGWAVTIITFHMNLLNTAVMNGQIWWEYL